VSSFRDGVDRAVGDAIHAAWSRVQHYGAIGPRHRAARRFASFGTGSMISFPATVIFGEGRIAIGERTSIGPNASLSAGMPMHADARGEPIISVGDRCVLGKGIGIVGHRRIEIGDDIWTGHYVYVTDQNHGYTDLDVPIGTQMWHDDAVSIGSGSWLGHGAVVLPGTQIGRHVVVAAGAVVRGVVPDNCIVGGVPARIIRRYDPATGSWDEPPSCDTVS
jgi:acetyltransferase-like isoleucine patch superfamily enzyme